MKQNAKLFLLFIAMSAYFEAIGQSVVTETVTITVEEVSMIRIYPSTTISLNLLASVAGESMSPKTHSGTYLQLTSIAPAYENRRITALITYGQVPAGTLLKLTPSMSTSGAGTRGSVSSTITLNRSNNQQIISGIGSTYTGTASSNGYRLNYSWEVDPANYASLQATSAVSLLVTYTISTY